MCVWLAADTHIGRGGVGLTCSNLSCFSLIFVVPAVFFFVLLKHERKGILVSSSLREVIIGIIKQQQKLAARFRTSSSISSLPLSLHNHETHDGSDCRGSQMAFVIKSVLQAFTHRSAISADLIRVLS